MRADPPRLWPLILILVLCASAYLLCFNSLQVGQHVDDASYVMLAQSLLSGRGYTQIAYPGAPPDLRYPPLLPLLIVPFLWLTHGALWATRLPALLAALGAIPVLYLLLRELRVPDPALWLVLALASLHPLVVGYAGMAMTEAPSSLVTWAVLLLALRQAANPRRDAPWLLVGVLLGLGLLLRTDLVALAGAVALWLALTRQWRALACVMLPALLLNLPWLLHVWHVSPLYPAEVSYARAWQSAPWDAAPPVLRLWHGVERYVGDFMPQVVALVFGSVLEQWASAHGAAAVVLALKWLTGLLVMVGLGLQARRWPLLVVLFVGLRLFMLFNWWPFTRLLLPVLPFLLLGLLTALGLCQCAPSNTQPGRRRARLCVGVLAALLVLALARDTMLVVQPPSRQYPDLVTGGKLIADHTPPEAVVMSTWSAKSFYLYSHRLARELDVPLDSELTPRQILRQAGPAQYLLLARRQEGPRFDEAKLLAEPRLQEVARSADNKLILLQIRKPI